MQDNGDEGEELLFPDLTTDDNSSLDLELEDKANTSENTNNEGLKKEIEDFQLSLEDEEEEDNDGNTSSHEGNNSSPSVVSSLALALREKGVLTTIEEDSIKNFKDAEELIEALVKDRENSSKAEFTEAQWKYIEGLRHGIPEEELKSDLYAEDAYNSVSKEDLEANEEMQKQVYFNDLVSNGITKEKATKIVTNAVNTGTLLEDSVDALSSLQAKSKEVINNKIAKAKQEQESNVQKAKEKVSKLKEDFLKTEEFSGITLNEAQRTKAFELMTKVIETDGKNPLNTIYADRKKNLEDFEKRQAIVYMLTDGFKNLNLLAQKEKSKAVLDLKAKLEGENRKAGAARKVPLSTTTEDFLSFLRKEGVK